MKIGGFKKRTGKIVKFEQKFITQAIFKAFKAVGSHNYSLAQKISDHVVKQLKGIPKQEEVQDLVEETLMENRLFKEAKAYILYREKRRQIREAILAEEKKIEAIDQYLKGLDWEIKENANMAFSLQGMNNFLTTRITRKYWLNKIYPQEVRKAVEDGSLHIHNLGILAVYCMGWNLSDLLRTGFSGVTSKIESKPARHFRSALGQVVNFFYTLSGESAGAQAFSNFDTLLAPFVRYDQLSYKEVKQAIQEFIFNCNVPTRVGFQCPFTNLTFDLIPPKNLAGQKVIIGGIEKKETYRQFQKEMDLINRAFSEIMIEGDAKNRPFTFPIPTYNITKDFPWENFVLNGIWDMTAKYGYPYFANFISSDLKPEDVYSMCCRLRLDKRQLYRRGGGLFGSSPLTGSIGVVTINLPRIGYLAKDKKDFFKRLAILMDLAKTSLEIKRKTLENFIEKGLYPYSKYYLEPIKKLRSKYYANHFSTIGLIGTNEALLNFMNENIASKRGRKFALEILNFMRGKLIKYQKETGNIYNLEATPAESTSYRLAKLDKKIYPKIITAGKKVPYYTNSSQLPVDSSGDLFESLRLQENLQSLYTGGTVFHAWLGERLEDGKTVKRLIKKIMENFKIPYFTFAPTFSVCPKHGYLNGEKNICPKCLKKTEVYSRVVGFLRPVSQWNVGKQEEFKDRKEFKISRDI